MPPTEDERFSQNFTTIKPFKLLSVFHSPGSLRFVALHKIFSNTACFKYNIFRHLLCGSLYQSPKIKTTVTPIAEQDRTEIYYD